MSQSRRYAEVVFPSPWTVAGIRLQPFTVGHALLLQRLGIEGRLQPGELLLALWVCSRDAITASHGLDSLRIKLTLKIWSWMLWRQRDRLEDVERAFYQYVIEANDGPSVNAREHSRSTGAPFLLSAISGLTRRGRTFEQAINTPLRVAIWEMAAWSDEAGGAEWLTDAEDEAIEAALKGSNG